jgi:PPK2 family polyphosphate:nucleotide phosphotransferase
MIFQAMDAAGKDSTIRAVLSGVDPAGCEVTAFKRPSENELDHDFLWRTVQCLPQRGRIGVFNRSYYEEVLAVRVHPEFLDHQKLPWRPKHLEDLWQQRFESIRDHEKHLARNGTVILKFWLNVSPEEQRKRLLARLEDPAKNWKFEEGDLAERGRWKDYMAAYEDALNQTSKPWAPWYAIPADSKSFMRMTVADILLRTLKSLNLKYPTLTDDELSKFGAMKKQLSKEKS